MSVKQDWTRVDVDHPCPFCGATKGCAVSAHGRVRCKDTDDAPPGYRRTTKQPTGEPEAHTFQPLTKQAAQRTRAAFSRRTVSATVRNSKGRKRAKVTRTLYYKYYFSDGKLAYEVRRIERADGSKECIPYHRNDEGTVVAGRPPTDQLVLYNLPAVMKANPRRRVYWVEGEKCANEAAKRGLVATTVIGGSSAAWSPSYSESLRQRHVVILPDNDKPGRKFANRVAAALFGVARSVRIVNLPGLDDGEDIVDWFAAGGTCRKLDRIAHKTPKLQRTDLVLSRFRLVSAAELKRMPPPRFLVDDLLLAESFTVLYGEPGSKKTFTAYDIAASIQAGAPWHGRQTQHGQVVYIAAEGRAGWPKRVRARELARRKENTDNLMFLLEAPQLLDDRDVGDLLTALEVLEPRPLLVVLDTMARTLVGGDENSAQDVGLFIAAVDRLRETLGCAVLVVHHTGKGKNSGAERGSSALRGAADVMMKTTKAAGNPYEFTLTCEKAKDFEAFKPIHLELQQAQVGTDEAGKPVTSCFVMLGERRGRIDNRPPQTETAQKALDVLARKVREDGHKDGVSRTDWKGATGASQGAFNAAVFALLKDGFVENERRGRYVFYRPKTDENHEDGRRTE